MNLNILPHTSEEMALAYKAAEDEYPSIPDEQLRSFRQLVNAQFAQISSKLSIEFVDYEPYGQNPKIADMLKDFHAGKLLIHTTEGPFVPVIKALTPYPALGNCLTAFRAGYSGI